MGDFDAKPFGTDMCDDEVSVQIPQRLGSRRLPAKEINSPPCNTQTSTRPRPNHAHVEAGGKEQTVNGIVSAIFQTGHGVGWKVGTTASSLTGQGKTAC
jgi:hypothetical protein